MEKLEEILGINQRFERVTNPGRETNQRMEQKSLENAGRSETRAVVKREQRCGTREAAGIPRFSLARMLTRGERVVASVRRAYHSFLSFFPFALDQVCERMGIKGNNLSGCECYSYFSVESLVSLTLLSQICLFFEFFVLC